MVELLAEQRLNPAGDAELALVVVDDECVCVEVSPGGAELLGSERSSLIGRPLAELLEPESRRRLVAIWEAFRSAGGHAGPFTIDRDDALQVSLAVTPSVLPSRHLIVLEPAGAGGRRFVSPPRAAGRGRGRRGRKPGGPTPRECEVLDLLAGGATDEQIAAQLGLSPATVQTHVRNAKAKLGARTRAQAVAMALRQGLISPP